MEVGLEATASNPTSIAGMPLISEAPRPETTPVASDEITLKPKKHKESVWLKPKAKRYPTEPQPDVLDDVANVKNAVLPSGLSDRRLALSTLKGQQLELTRIGQLANEAIANQKEQEEVNSAVKQFQAAIEEIKTLGEETESIIKEVKQNQRDRLTRALTGKINQNSARTAALYKRVYETLNPRKLVRMPKGASQAEYYAAMLAISQGDKKAIAQYTVKKPKKLKPKKQTPVEKPAPSSLNLKPKNKIAPSSLSDRRDILTQIKKWDAQLTQLGAEANEAIEDMKTPDSPNAAIDKWANGIDSLEVLSEKIKQDQAAGFDRMLKGRLAKVDAKIVSAQKKIFEIRNPTKRIVAPKGTTQAEYKVIVDRLRAGDEEAIAQYTVKKPKKLKPKKKPTQKKLSKS